MNNKKKLRLYALVIVLLLGIIFLLIGFHLEDNIRQIFSQLTLTIATALLAAAILGVLKLDDMAKFEGILETYSEMERRGVRKIGTPNHFDDEIKEKIGEMRKGHKIQVMLHAGQTFLNTFKPDVIDAIERGCDIEILISSPDISVDKYPDILHSLCGGTRKSDIDKFEKDFFDIVKEIEQNKPNKISKYGSTIIVKQYNFVPAGNILIIGNYIRFIPYLSNRNSSNSIAIVGHANIGREGRFDIFKIIFNEIFNDTRTGKEAKTLLEKNL